MGYPYRVVVSKAQRAEFTNPIPDGVAPARMLTCARILFKPTTGRPVTGGWMRPLWGRPMSLPIRRQFAIAGLAGTLDRKGPDRVCERMLNGEQGAKLVVLICSDPPAGVDRGSLRLLAIEVVRLEIAPAISHETVRRTLKNWRLRIDALPHVMSLSTRGPEGVHADALFRFVKTMY